LVEHLFVKHLAPSVRILSQPEVVADSLEHYLERRPHYAECNQAGSLQLLTTGDAEEISARARVFWPDVAAFSHVAT
jgi:glutamate racemase